MLLFYLLEPRGPGYLIGARSSLSPSTSCFWHLPAFNGGRDDYVLVTPSLTLLIALM